MNLRDRNLMKMLGALGRSGILYRQGYKFIKELGVGGSSIVGLYEKNGKQYAVKIIQIDKQDQNQSLASTDKESFIIKRLDENLHLCKSAADFILKYETLKGSRAKFVFFVSDPMKSSLWDAPRSIIDKNLIQMVCQLFYAVDCLHRIGLIHGDLKPQNIMLDRDNSIKIADFGESAWIEKERSMPLFYAQLTGWTPYWCPPEALKIDPVAPSTKYDIWSLGLIILWLVDPYAPIDSLKKFSQKKIDKIVTNSVSSVFIRDLLHKMLRKSPNTRPELRDILNDVSECKT